ncbi:DUF6636 domain-containing protein [Mycobacterium sp.]|uniref:DUF6636 domain-containing protein n=1 Tax=Mycobacterium sp. TaxID=1785 RepID=UPI002D9BC8EA|nr:DUF6636 domain-containing protein [Mycobacterium sp.]
MTHRAERLAAAVAGFAAVIALSGCGSPTDVQAASTATPVTGQATAPARPVQSTSPAPDGDAVESASFLSPDGNIACNVDMNVGARCDIIDASWPTPPTPADCQGSYGHMIAIGIDEPAEFICTDDTVFGSEDLLADGESIASGAFRCESVDSGITCRNTETGHGFSLSYDANELF